MDAATQSIIVVIAHPIAGNPTQLAVERALAAMELDWRVLSLDVRSEDVSTAMQGFSVTGIAGVLIDASLRDAATNWYRETVDSESGPIDCLYRDKTGKFAGENQQRQWISDLIGAATEEESDSQPRIWFGESLAESVVDTDQFPTEPAVAPLDGEIAENVKWIALSEAANEPVELEVEEWPKNDGSIGVIDLSNNSFTEGHPDLGKIDDLGYRTVDFCERKIGTLQRCLKRWTGSEPSAEVLRDAIEEYLGV